MWVILFLLLVLLTYILFDVHYFVRCSLTLLFAKFIRKKISVSEPSVLYGMVLTSDIDLLLSHMNNSRYLREYDFARFDFMTRTGILEESLRLKGSFPASAICTRYRLPAMFLSFYKIETRMIYWDAKYIYFEHKMITLRDNIVRNITNMKTACVNFDGEEIIKKLHPTAVKPEMPLDIERWNEACDLSREKLKKEK